MPSHHIVRIAGLAALLSIFSLAHGGISGTGKENKGSGFSVFSLLATDAPADELEAVVVRFTGVELRSQNTLQRFDIFPAKRIDLLQLRGRQSDSLLDQVRAQDGHYQHIRLFVDSTDAGCQNLTTPWSSYVQVDGTRYPLVVPGRNPVLQFAGAITIDSGSANTYAIDFDLRRAISKPQGQACYVLKPSFRTVAVADSGSVSGLIDQSWLENEHCLTNPLSGHGAAVYVFAAGSPLTDMRPGGGPVTSDGLRTQPQGSKLGYEIGFLPAGEYTLALSCSAAQDDPDQREELRFDSLQSVTIRAGEHSVVNFTQH